MLRLLLDEHLSPKVAEGLRRRNKSISVLGLVEWENGAFLGLPDETVLQAAAAQGRTLVTYDRRTIPPLLKRWAESGQTHGGIIFVDEKTIPPSDLGGLMQSLLELVETASDWDWADRVCFLRR